MFKVTKVFEENGKSVAFEVVDDYGQRNVSGRQQLINAINQNLIQNAKAYNKGGTTVITVAKNIPKVPYVASSDVVRFEDYFKQVIRYAVSHGKDIQLTGNFARDFCYQGDYNMANLIKVVEQYRSAVQIPDRLFFNSQESYISFIASALNGMEYYIGVVTMFSFKKVALSQNSKNIILAFASNSEIRGWSVAPVKSAKLVHFTADGQEVVKDISSSIWR